MHARLRKGGPRAAGELPLGRGLLVRPREAEERGLACSRGAEFGILLDFEDASACGHGGAHDDGLANPCDIISTSVQGCIEQVVCGLLKGRQRQHAVLHLGDAKAGDAQDVALQSHCPLSGCHTGHSPVQT